MLFPIAEANWVLKDHLHSPCLYHLRGYHSDEVSVTKHPRPYSRIVFGGIICRRTRCPRRRLSRSGEKIVRQGLSDRSKLCSFFGDLAKLIDAWWNRDKRKPDEGFLKALAGYRRDCALYSLFGGR